MVLTLTVIVLAGAGLRGWEAAHPRLADESTDERIYGTLARTLGENLNYGDRSAGPHHPFIAAPGAPVVFALAYRITPSARASPTDIPAAYWLLALAGTLLIVATFALGRTLGGDAAGLVAATAIAGYPPFVRTTGELLSEPLGALLLTVALVALVSARRSGKPRQFALGGALLGLAALARPDLLIVMFACPLAVLLLSLPSGRRRAGAAHAVMVLATGSLVVAPWVAYASLRSKYLVPIVESGTPTLIIGSYLPGDGNTAGFKRSIGDETRARMPWLRGMTDLELPGAAVIETVRARHPAVTRREALRAEAVENLRRYALGRPAAFAAMMGRKVARMWRRPSQDHSPATDIAHRIGLVLALAGILAGLSFGRRADLVLVIGAIASSTLLHAVLVAHPRYALPLIPALVAGGASGLAAVWSRSSRLRSRVAIGRATSAAPL